MSRYAVHWQLRKFGDTLRNVGAVGSRARTVNEQKFAYVGLYVIEVTIKGTQRRVSALTSCASKSRRPTLAKNEKYIRTLM